jgi:hypothetical protein
MSIVAPFAPGTVNGLSSFVKASFENLVPVRRVFFGDLLRLD